MWAPVAYPSSAGTKSLVTGNRAIGTVAWVADTSSAVGVGTSHKDPEDTGWLEVPATEQIAGYHV